MKPIVAIVGRPNVGKSTLFNKITGKRISIVEDTPGITRDRIYADAEWTGREFTLIDTGGIEPSSKDVILSQMRSQANLAVDMADVILFMVNIKEGMTAADNEVAAMLRKCGKPVIPVCNKVDTPGNPPMELYEFYNLGMGEPFAISSVHGLGVGDLLDEVVSLFPEDSADSEDDGRNQSCNNRKAERGKIIIDKPHFGRKSCYCQRHRRHNARCNRQHIYSRRQKIYFD